MTDLENSPTQLQRILLQRISEEGQDYTVYAPTHIQSPGSSRTHTSSQRDCGRRLQQQTCQAPSVSRHSLQQQL